MFYLNALLLHPTNGNNRCIYICSRHSPGYAKKSSETQKTQPGDLIVSFNDRKMSAKLLKIGSSFIFRAISCEPFSCNVWMNISGTNYDNLLTITSCYSPLSEYWCQTSLILRILISKPLTSWSKLPELWSQHFSGNIHFYVQFPVVDFEL